MDEDGDFVVGRPALEKDANFALKLWLIFRAINDMEVIKKMPRGRDFLEAFASNTDVFAIIDKNLRERLQFLRSLSDSFTARLEKTIDQIVLTYPSYICDYRQADYWAKSDLVMVDIEKMAYSVWGDVCSYCFISEAQALAQFICERYSNAYFGPENMDCFALLFLDLNVQSELLFVFYDWGNSGVVCVMFVS